MAENRGQIKILRANSITEDVGKVILEEGQPFYDKETKYLYIGEDKSITDSIPVIAAYASSDISKGTIEERLTKLGFKEGSVDSDFASTTLNKLTRQGNYVIGDVYFTPATSNALFGWNSGDILGVIPENFRPKSYNRFKIWVKGEFNILVSYYCYSEVEVHITLDGLIKLGSITQDRYTKSGDYYTYSKVSDQVTCYGIHLQFAYEAAPL